MEIRGSSAKETPGLEKPWFPSLKPSGYPSPVNVCVCVCVCVRVVVCAKPEGKPFQALVIGSVVPHPPQRVPASPAALRLCDCVVALLAAHTQWTL